MLYFATKHLCFRPSTVRVLLSESAKTKKQKIFSVAVVACSSTTTTRPEDRLPSGFNGFNYPRRYVAHLCLLHKSARADYCSNYFLPPLSICHYTFQHVLNTVSFTEVRPKSEMQTTALCRSSPVARLQWHRDCRSAVSLALSSPGTLQGVYIVGTQVFHRQRSFLSQRFSRHRGHLV